MTAPDQTTSDRPQSHRLSGQDLNQAIVGAAPVFTAAEVAEAGGVDPVIARRLWRAFGFPEYADSVAFSQSDVLALDTITTTVERGSIDIDTAINLTRALGQTMARLADWQVVTLLTRVDELADELCRYEVPRSGSAGHEPGGSDSGGPETLTEGRIKAALTLIDELSGPFEDLMVYAWRRHLAAAAARTTGLIGVPGEGEDAAINGRKASLTVGFADMVSFTSLSNTLGADRIGELVEVFESRCGDVVTAHGGRIIKSLGDSVLFVNEDAVRAVSTAEGIVTVIGRDARMPDVRLGLATGATVLRLGDVFGPPVNLSARLTAVARRNRIIVDAATAALLPEVSFETRRLPPRPIQGFGPVEPLTVRRH
ncbi:MAG: adenylate/guanylate cyclase domain-containing protein [Nocardioides sp.]